MVMVTAITPTATTPTSVWIHQPEKRLMATDAHSLSLTPTWTVSAMLMTPVPTRQQANRSTVSVVQAVRKTPITMVSWMLSTHAPTRLWALWSMLQDAPPANWTPTVIPSRTTAISARPPQRVNP